MIIEAFMNGLSPQRLIIDRSGSSNYYNKSFGLIKDELTALACFLS
jgi:hypothetical protein